MTDQKDPDDWFANSLIKGVTPLWAMETANIWITRAQRHYRISLSGPEAVMMRAAVTAAVLDASGGVGPDGEGPADMIALGLWEKK